MSSCVSLVKLVSGMTSKYAIRFEIWRKGWVRGQPCEYRDGCQLCSIGSNEKSPGHYFPRKLVTFKLLITLCWWVAYVCNFACMRLWVLGRIKSPTSKSGLLSSNWMYLKDGILPALLSEGEYFMPSLASGPTVWKLLIMIPINWVFSELVWLLFKPRAALGMPLSGMMEAILETGAGRTRVKLKKIPYCMN